MVARARIPMLEPLPAVAGESHDSVLLHGISWDLYERLREATEDQHVRMTFDRGDLEIMSPLPKHEKFKILVRMLIEEASRLLNVDLACFGSMTCKRKDLECGLEPDECYYIDKAQAMWIKTEIDFQIDPPPDLAVEIDVTSSSMNKHSIYAELGVQELWRYNGKSFRIYHRIKGKYVLKHTSKYFPQLPVEGFEKFLTTWDSYSDPRDWLAAFRQWLQTVVAKKS